MQHLRNALDVCGVGLEEMQEQLQGIALPISLRSPETVHSLFTTLMHLSPQEPRNHKLPSALHQKGTTMQRF